MKLLLVDGSAVLHRAYHAYPPLTTRTGEIVGAVYGVTSILINVLNEVKPTHVVVAWDLPKPTFRHIKYVGYKAQRPKADEEMVLQIPLVKEVIAEMGLTQSEIEGYEADDIIGTLAKQGSELVGSSEPCEVIILTGDQDTMQLVNDKVKIMTPPKGKEPGKTYGVEEVRVKYGVRPDQIVDLKALVGDPSDNIPGVAGIGPVTAAKLLQEYETLENIYEAINKKSEAKNSKQIQNSKLVEKLEKGRESAILSQELSRIVLDVPIDIKEGEMEYKSLQGVTLRGKLEELGFKSLIRRIWGAPTSHKASEGQGKDNNNQMSMF